MLIARPIVLFAALVSSVVLSGSVHADHGSTRAFVEETREWQARWQGGVRNELVNTEWITDDRVLYRLDNDGGKWTFMICYAGDGTTRPAFDHGLVGAQLISLVGNELEASQLPFARFAAVGSDLVAMVDIASAGRLELPIVRISGDTVSVADQIPEAFNARRVNRRSSGSGPRGGTTLRDHPARPGRHPHNVYWPRVVGSGGRA